MTAVISHSAGSTVMLQPGAHPLFPHIEPSSFLLPFTPLYSALSFSFSSSFLFFFPLPLSPSTFSSLPPWLRSSTTVFSVKFYIRESLEKYTRLTQISRLLLLPLTYLAILRSLILPPSTNQRVSTDKYAPRNVHKSHLFDDRDHSPINSLFPAMIIGRSLSLERCFAYDSIL